MDLGKWKKAIKNTYAEKNIKRLGRQGVLIMHKSVHVSWAYVQRTRKRRHSQKLNDHILVQVWAAKHPDPTG